MPVRRALPHPAPWTGLGVGTALALVVTAALVPLRGDVTQATPALLLVVPVVVAAVLGGRLAALVVAVLAAGAFNLAFIPPYWNPRVGVVDDGVALAVFLAVALTTGTLVAQSAERRQAAEQLAEELQAAHDRYSLGVEERVRLAEAAHPVCVRVQVD